MTCLLHFTCPAPQDSALPKTRWSAFGIFRRSSAGCAARCTPGERKCFASRGDARLFHFECSTVYRTPAAAAANPGKVHAASHYSLTYYLLAERSCCTAFCSRNLHQGCPLQEKPSIQRQRVRDISAVLHIQSQIKSRTIRIIRIITNNYIKIINTFFARTNC